MSAKRSRARLLWGLLRPAGLPWVAASPAVGYGLAHWGTALPPQHAWGLAACALAWAFLHAGTMWWNAALDRDEGPVLYGEALPVPPGLTRLGTLALMASVALASLAGTGAALCAAACALMALGYSHPRVAWKARAWAGPAINAVGYGVLSPLAGYAAVDVAFDLRTALLLLVSALSVLGAYFVAQAFQADEDRARGYRTLVATGGAAAALRAAHAAFRGSHLLALALAFGGWLPRPCLIAFPAVMALDLSLRRSLLDPETFDEPAARQMLLGALLVGLLFVIGACGAWIYEVAHGLPLAGLGTVAGHV